MWAGFCPSCLSPQWALTCSVEIMQPQVMTLKAEEVRTWQSCTARKWQSWDSKPAGDSGVCTLSTPTSTIQCGLNRPRPCRGGGSLSAMQEAFLSRWSEGGPPAVWQMVLRPLLPRQVSVRT